VIIWRFLCSISILLLAVMSVVQLPLPLLDSQYTGVHIRLNTVEKDLVRDTAMCGKSHGLGMPPILPPRSLALPLLLAPKPPATSRGSWHKPALFGMECP